MGVACATHSTPCDGARWTNHPKAEFITRFMQRRIQLTDLYAAPGFLDASGDAGSGLDSERVAALYSFLPAYTALSLEAESVIISRPDLPQKREAEVTELLERAAKRAREGDHDKAIEQYECALAIAPLQVTVRRDLAMSRMAKGDTVGADAELRRLLLLAPADAWAWIILGNLNFRQNFALAERYFRRAVELAPGDPYAWNGMGVMYAEKRDFSQAITAFRNALQANPRFANAHLGLASALSDSGDLRRAFDVLERMFATSSVQDSRALPTFEYASRTYRSLAQRIAEDTLTSGEADIDSLHAEAERISRYPVRFEESDIGAQATAITETAWQHGRDHHVIRVRQSLAPAVKLHMRAHELCRLILQAEARNAGTNRRFTTDESHRALAVREIESELSGVRRAVPAHAVEGLIDQLFRGLMSQLYNLPIDMIIERRIATRHPALRFAQVQSVGLVIEEAVKGCSAPDIVRVVPRRILHASRFLNACYAAFVDHQFAGALAASPPFIQMGAMDRGLGLFQLWEKETAHLTPGSEYEVVDKFAADLRLGGWFQWQDEPSEAASESSTEGSSNPELLALKAPAAVFHFLEILKRLDGMDGETIKHVAAESARAGETGLDYASPEKSYRVPAYGEEMLSGLEVMCVMFAAFQHFAPQHDLAIDLHDAYEKALALHEARKREGQ